MHTALASKGGVLELEDLCSIRTFTSASERIRKYLGTYREEFPPLRMNTAGYTPLKS
jgi:hypothetical protein